MDDIEKIEPLLTAQEVKRLLKCSLPWIYKASAQGLLPSIKIPCPGEGKKRSKVMVRFKREDVFQFIEKYFLRRSWFLFNLKSQPF